MPSATSPLQKLPAIQAKNCPVRQFSAAVNPDAVLSSISPCPVHHVTNGVIPSPRPTMMTPLPRIQVHDVTSHAGISLSFNRIYAHHHHHPLDLSVNENEKKRK
jgi:hypothetical protein